MYELLKIKKTNKETSRELKNILIRENSKRFLYLFSLIAISQIIFIFLELIKVLRWESTIFISRIIIICICLIFVGLLYFFSRIKDNKISLLALEILTSLIQISIILVGCYFVVYMFSNGIYSYSSFLLVALILSLTCIRTPNTFGIVLLMFFIGLTLFLSANSAQFTIWMSEFIIALVVVFLLYFGNIFNYNRHLKLYIKDEEILEVNKKYKAIMHTDELTGIYNRRKISEVINEKIDFSKRYKEWGFCIAILDIDHFKKVNDKYGHNTGDAILYQFANNINLMLRSTDNMGRWGGEEFIIVLPKCNNNEAYLLIERLRKNIEAFDFSKVGKVTFSAGISCFEEQDTFSELTEKADLALYTSKDNGRNQTQIYQLNM
jgi:diguanylate cyclase (GGDEF)-like protein